MKEDEVMVHVDLVAGLSWGSPPKNREEEISRRLADNAVRDIAARIQGDVANIIKSIIDLESGR